MKTEENKEALNSTLVCQIDDHFLSKFRSNTSRKLGNNALDPPRL
jgi:hypothetical protein